MKIAFLSDLHIGPPFHPADDFGANRNLLGTLRTLSEQVDRIVLNGDIFELWQFGWIEIAPMRGREIAAINRYADVLVRGNHDMGLHASLLPDVSVVDSWSHGDLRVIHGHQEDVWNSGPLGWVGRMVARWGKIGEVAVSRNIDRWFFSLQEFLNNGRYGRNMTYRNRIRQSAGPETGAVVMGHTHVVDTGLYPPGVPIWNSGTWTGGRRDVLIVSGNVGNWECWKWS